MQPTAAPQRLYRDCSAWVFALICLSSGGPGGSAWTAAIAPAGERTPHDGAPRVTLIAEIANPVRLLEHQGIPVTVGYGSAVAVDPHHAHRFFLLTDRGPNVDGAEGHMRFLMPEYAPRIGHFELVDQSLRLLSERELTDANGRRLTGLPPAPEAGGSGEVPEQPDGTRLEFDREGIDSEGLVVLSEGGFWVSEEYRPSLLHFTAEGRMIERIDPLDSQRRRLPQVFRRRRPNRGLEGLTILPDGKTLVAVSEQPLDNPSNDRTKDSRVVRILMFDIRTAQTRQYLYLQDQPGTCISEIAAMDDERFFVLERDRKRPSDPRDPTKISRIYQIDVRHATDVSDPKDTPQGLCINGRTLEELRPEQLKSAGIQPVSKTLVVDLQGLDDGYPHDKPEGLAALPGGRLVLTNDPDFGVDDDGHGAVIPKRLPADANRIDRTRLYLIEMKAPIGE